MSLSRRLRKFFGGEESGRVARKVPRGGPRHFEQMEERLTPSGTTLKWIGTTSAWSDAANWSIVTGTDTSPQTGDTLIFDTTFGSFAGTAAAFAPSNDTAATDLTISIIDSSGAGDFSFSGNAVALNVAGITHSLTTGTATTINFGGAGLTLTGTTAFMNSAGALTISSGIGGTGTIATSGAGTTSVTGAVTLTGSVMQVGPGTLALSNAGNTYAGGTTINGGVVTISNATAAGAVTINSTGVFEINNITHNAAVALNSGGTLRGIGASARENGVITVAAASVTIGTGATATDVLTLSDGANDLTGGGAGTLVNITGAGRVALTQASNLNNQSKWVVGPGATLGLNAAETVLGAVPGSFVADYITINGGTLRAGAAVAIAANRGITLTANGATFNNAQGGGNFQILSIISGPGAVLVNNTGTSPYVPSAQSTYLGGTTIQAGTVVPTVNSGSPTAGPFGAGTLTLAGAQIRATTGNDVTLANPVAFNADTTVPSPTGDKILTFTGTITLNGTRTLTQNSLAAVVFNGPIAGAGTSFIKAGTGVLNLNSSTSSHASTTISAGSLILGTGASLGSTTGTVTVATTGTAATLGGTGSVNRPLIVNNNGRLDPALTTTSGTLATDNTVTFNASSQFNVGINNNATPNSDLFTYSNAAPLDLSLATLTVSKLTGFTTSTTTFTILQSTGGAITNTFQGRPNGSTFTVGGDTFVINYTASAVTITNTPPRFFVNDNWANQTNGADADGAGPLTAAIFNTNAFTTIQAAVTAATTANSIIVVLGGSYPAAVNLTAATPLIFQFINDTVDAVATATIGGNVNLAAAISVTDDTSDPGITVGSAVFGSLNGASAFTSTLTTSPITFNSVGATTPLTTLTTATAAATTLGGNVTTSGTQTYAGPVLLSGPAALATTNAAVAFSSTVDAAPAAVNPSLSVASGTAATTFTGAVGGTLPIVGLSATGGAITMAAVALVSSGAAGVSITNSAASSITGVLAGGGTLTKAGTGTLTLGNANTYTGSTTISGGQLTIGADASLGTAPASPTPNAIAINGGTLSITATTTLSANRGMGIGPAGATLTFPTGMTITYNGVIADNGGSGTITRGVSGSGGTLILGGNNTFTGAFVNNFGNVQATSSTTFGASSGGVTFANGTVLLILNNSAVAGESLITPIIQSVSGTNSWSGPIQAVNAAPQLTLQVDAGTFTVSGDVNAASPDAVAHNLVVGGAGGTGIVSGAISNPLLVSKTGANTWTFSGNNAYSAATSVTTGSLIAASPTAFGDTSNGVTVSSGARVEMSGGITVVGETITINGNGTNNFGALQSASGNNVWQGPVILGNTANTRIGANGGTLTIDGVISDGVNTVDLNVRSNEGAAGAAVIIKQPATYKGATNIIVNPLRLGVDNALPAGTLVNFGNGSNTGTAVLDLAGFNQTVAGLATVAGATTMAMNVTNSAGTLSTLTLNTTATNSLTGSSASTGILKGTGDVALVMQGSGTQVLGGTATFTGGATINSGTLRLASAAGLGSGNIVTFGASSTGVLQLNGLSAALAGLRTNVTPGTPIVENASATAATLTLNETGSFAYAGVLQDGTGGGALSLTKTGTGTQTLSGSASSYTGTTRVNAGTLAVGANAPSGANGALGNSSAAVLLGDTTGTAAATLAIAASGVSVGRSVTVQTGSSGAKTFAAGAGTAAFAGPILLNASASIDVAGGGTLNFTGAISGAGGLTNTNAGVTVLAVANTYVGATAVNAGFLTINGSVTSNVTANSGGTLQGSGTVTGNVLGAGNFSPGTSPGVMTITGNFTPTGTVTFEVNAPYTTPGVDFDRYSVGGSVDLSGASLAFVSTIPGGAQQVMTLISKTSGGATVASSNPAEGAVVSVGGNSYEINYNSGDGNDVVLNIATGILYVDDAWTGFAMNTPIPDADDGTAAAEPAIFGVTAFATPSAAAAVASAGGTIIVNDGSYSTNFVSLTNTVTLQLTRRALGTQNSTVTIGSIDSAAGTTVGLGTNTLVLSDGDNSATNTLAGNLAGSGTFTKQGSDTLILSAANGFTGPTLISAGVLRASDATALGTSAVTVGAATLELAGVSIANTLLLNNGATLRGTGSATYSASGNPVIASGATVTFSTAAVADTLNIGSGYTNAGGSTATPTINIAGPGMVALNSSSSGFRGNWVVQAGTLRATQAGAFGIPTVSGSLTGSTLNLAGGNLLVRASADVNFNAGSGTSLPVTISGVAANITSQNSSGTTVFAPTFGTLHFTGGNTLTTNHDGTITTAGDLQFIFAGQMTAAGDATIAMPRNNASVRNVLRLNGGISDGGAVRKFTFNNSGASANETVVAVSSTRTLGPTSEIILTGTQPIRYVLTNPFASDTSRLRFNNSGGGATFDFRNDTPATFNNAVIADTSGVLMVSRVAAGAGVVPSIGSLTINNGRTVSVTAATTLTTNTAYGITVLGGGALAGSTTISVSNNGSGAGTLTFGGTVADGPSAGSLTKAGAGVLAMTGANTFTGVTTMTAGTLSINTIKNVGGGASSLGAPTTIANGTIVHNSGVIMYTGAGDSTDRAFNIAAGDGTSALDASGAGPLTWNGNVSGAHSFTLRGTGVGTLAGVYNATAGNLNKTGTGTWTLSGNNTHTGLTQVQAGTLIVTSAAGLGGLGAGGATTITAGATLDLRAAVGNEVVNLAGAGVGGIGGLITGAGSGSVNTATMTADSTVGGAGALSITVVAGTGFNLAKTGTGTVTLGGVSTYTGTTTVNQGTLLVNGSIVNGPAATDVVVAGGVLGGTGSIPGTIQATGGAIAPGTTTTGTLSTGPVGLAAAASLNIDVVGPAVDLLTVTGGVSLGNAQLAINPAATPLVPSGPYLIVNNVTPGPVSGIFFKPGGVTPLNQGDQIGIFGGVPLYISYFGGDGNDIELLTTVGTINGTPGNDTLVVRQLNATQIESSFNGGSFIPFDSSLTLTFNGQGGADQILLDLNTATPFNGHLMFDGESIRVQGGGTGTASYLPQDADKIHAASGFLNFAGSPSIDFVGLADASVLAATGAYTLQNGSTTSVGGTLPGGYTVVSQAALTAVGGGVSVRFAGNALSHVDTGFGPGDTITVAAAGATADGPLELTGVTIGGSGVLAGTSLDATALAGIMLNTSIASLTAQTFDLAGDIVIVETDAIDLTSVETFGGSVSVSAGGDINVSYVAAFDSSISLQVTGASGSVLDFNNDASADVRAAFGITLVARGTGTIGTSANPLDLDSYGVGIIDALSGQTDDKDIYLTVESGDVRILKLNAVAGGGLVPAVTSGNVALTTDGNVFMDSDAFGGGADIVANLVTLTATGELGTNANPLELNAITLATSTISGGLLDSAQFLAEADSVAIGSSGLNPGNASVNLERLGAGSPIYNFSSGDSINDAARLNLADGVQVVMNDDEILGALGDYPGHVATAAFADVLFAGRTLTVGANGNDTSYSGTLSGANGQLVKTGVGRFTEIDAGLNTYSGLTTVENGALVLAKTGGGNKAIAGPVMLGDSVGATGSAVLEIGANEQIADGANIQFTGIDGRLLSTAGTTETITTPTDFAGGDVKVAGLLITTNAYDQPTGTTTLNGGVLRVGAAGTLNSSLGTSATPGGTLQGSGTIYTNILTSWGTIDPSSGVTDLDVGNRSPGRITVRGNLQMTASSTTNLDVAPTGSDQLNVGINPALALPAGSYTNLSNYDLDPYLRGDVAAVTEPGRRGVNDLYNINGTVRLNGTLNTRPIQGSVLTNNVTYGNSMNFVWRALNLPMGGFWGDLNPKGGNLSSVPSDFTTRNSLDVNGLPTTALQFDPRFMGSGGQFNAVGQSVGYVVKFMGNDQAGLTAPAYSVGQAKGMTLTSLTSTATVDTTAVKVTKQLWNAMKDSHTRVTLTITNTSAAAVTGPIYVELVGVPAGATVFNAAGKRPSTGKPYLVVPAASLAAGAAVTMEVDLLTPVMLGKTAALTTQVLRGGMP